MFLKASDMLDDDDGPSGGSSGRTGLSTGVGLSSAGGAGGGAGARGPSTPSRPTSATATGAVGRHGYGMNSPSRSGYGGYGAAGGRPSYGAPSYGGSGYGRPSYGGTGYGGYNRPATTSVMSSTSSSADPYSGGGSKTSSASPGGASRPHTTGGLGMAGALSTTEGRKSMLERQKALAMQRRNRLSGGIVATSRAIDGPEAPRSPASNPQRTPSIRQFSAPRLITAKDDARASDDAPPAKGTGSPSGSMSLAEVIREREKQKMMDPSSRPGSGPMTPVERDMARHGLTKTFDPSGGAAPQARAAGGASGAAALDFSDMKTFLTTPAPRGAGIIECYIHRNKSGMNKLYPVYHLFMKEGDRFLLAGKKRAKQKTSNYLISMKKDDLSRTGANYLGKLRSNFVGTEFYVYDSGLNPKEVDKAAARSGTVNVREELGLVTYASNVLGSKGPRKMKVCLPRVTKGQRRQFKPLTKESELMAKYKSKDLSDVQMLINKPPRWNEQVGAYVLNFNGRVTMASVKNFQLVDPDDQEPVLLQFGRVGKDVFTMDYQYPLSPLQAFAVCLSSFDYKIACE